MASSGSDYVARNAGQQWSLTAPDPNTLRFQVVKGDAAPIDAGAYTPTARSDVIFSQAYGNNTPLDLNFNLVIEPGAANSASFFVLGQFVATMADGSIAPQPPFDIDLVGDEMIVYVRFTTASGTVGGQAIYVTDGNLIRGQSYNIDVKANFDPSGNGRLVLSLNGTVVADYQGPLGFAGQQSVSWAEGIDRGANAVETTAVDFSSNTSTTGSQVTLPPPVTYLAPPSLAIQTVQYVSGQTNVFVADMFGYAYGNSTVNIYADGVLVGTTTAAVNGYFEDFVNVQGPGVHVLNASYTTSSGQQSVSSAPFNSTFTIGSAGDPAEVTPVNFFLTLNGQTFWVQNAAKPYSFSAPAANTIRFEVHQGDAFIFDQHTGLYSQRSEIRDETDIPNGTPVNLSFQFMLEPGAPSDAQFLVVGQFHQNDGIGLPPYSPPFEIAFVGEYMELNVRYTGANGLPITQTIYMDVNPIVRGQYYNFSISAVFDPSGQNGRLVVYRNGNIIADYSGPLGYATENGVYWKEGIYRSHNSTVIMADDFQNTTVTTGANVVFPPQSAFIAAPTLTSASVTANSNGTNTVQITGATKLGTQLTITENGPPIGTASADASGNYLATLALNTSTPHSLQIFATDSTGAQGLPTVIEIDTAADILTRLPALDTEIGLGGIILSDTNVFNVLTSTQLVSLVNANVAALSKILQPYTFSRTQSVTGQSYDTVVQKYTSAAVLYETDRYSSSKLVYKLVIAADKSQIITNYPTSGGFTVQYVSSAGVTTEIDQTNAANILFSTDVRYPDGSRLVSSFNPSTGVQSGYTSYDALGNKSIATVNISGQAYTKQVSNYNAAGKLLSQQRFTSSGVLIYAFLYFSDGTSALHNYSATTGLETNATYYNPDGTYSVMTDQITGQAYAAKRVYYTSAAKITGTDTFDANGKLLTSDQWPSDASHIVFSVDASGVKIGFTQTYTDNTRQVVTYTVGVSGQIARADHFSASGVLVETDLYSGGLKASGDIFNPAGGDVLTSYNPLTGTATGYTQTNADGSKSVVVYVAGTSNQVARISSYNASGVLLEIDLYSGGQKVSTDVFTPGAGDLLTMLDPSSGLATGFTQTNADGSKTVEVYVVGQVGQPARIAYYDPSGVLLEVDLYSGGKKVSTDVYTPGSGDLLTTFDPSSGLATGFAQTKADGSKTVEVYVVGQPGTPASVQYYNPSGFLLETDLYSSGRRVSTDIFALGGGDLLTTFDPTTGYITGTIQTNVDGSTSFGRYVASVLVEIDSYNAAGQLVATQIYGIGVASLTTTYNPSTGIVTGTVQINVDGSKSVALYAGGGVTEIDQYNAGGAFISSNVFTAGGSILTIYNPNVPGLVQEIDQYVGGQEVSIDVFTPGMGDVLTTINPSSGLATGFTQTNADGSKVVETYAAGLPGQPASIAYYSPSGFLNEIDLYQAGIRISSDVYAPGGGDFLTAYDPTTGFVTGTVQANANNVTSIGRYVANILIETDAYNAVGQMLSSTLLGNASASFLTTYDPTAGLITGTTQTNGDGSKSVGLYAKGMLTETDAYNAAGQFISSIIFSGGGSLLTTFDPVNGLATGYTKTSADGSSSVATYLAGSVSQLASLNAYSTSGALVASQMWGSDGSRKVYSFSNGQENGYTLYAANGNKTIASFALGNEAMLIQASIFDSTNRLAENDIYTNGILTQSTIKNVDKSSVVTLYAIANKPYTQQSTFYSPTGAVTSAARWYGDANHTVQFAETFNPDGSMIIHNYDTSGRETVRQLYAADGSRDVFSYTYAAVGSIPSKTQQDHYNSSNVNVWSDTTNADGSHVTTVKAAAVSVTASIGSNDTLTSSSSGGDTFVFKPAIGQDIITNFHSGTGSNFDTLDLSALNLLGPGQTSANYLASALTQSGRDAVLTVAPNQTITLKNTIVASLTSNDFNFGTTQRQT